MRKIAANAIAAAASAAAGVAAYSALSRDAALGLVKTNAAVDAFTVSLFPVFAGLWLAFFSWQATGRRASVLFYGLGSPLLGFALLKAYFYVAYGYGPVFSFGAQDLPLAAALSLSGSAFALVRNALKNPDKE